MRGWHQDSGRLNHELETDPQPRVSLKVAFFLSDCSVAGSGNFGAVPGSHLTNALVDPERTDVDPPGATVVLVPRGGMVLFDRRIWHTGTENHADYPRKALFYGYSYRWLRPRDDMQVAHYLERSDPIRRQLLGTSPSGGRGYTSPQPEDVPLRTWLEQNPTDPGGRGRRRRAALLNLSARRPPPCGEAVRSAQPPVRTLPAKPARLLA